DPYTRCPVCRKVVPPPATGRQIYCSTRCRTRAQAQREGRPTRPPLLRLRYEPRQTPSGWAVLEFERDAFTLRTRTLAVLPTQAEARAQVRELRTHAALTEALVKAIASGDADSAATLTVLVLRRGR